MHSEETAVDIDCILHYYPLYGRQTEGLYLLPRLVTKLDQ